jgi:hypothetical protein
VNKIKIKYEDERDVITINPPSHAVEAVGMISRRFSESWMMSYCQRGNENDGKPSTWLKNLMLRAMGDG